MAEKLFGVLKEVGKKPQVKVIWNTDEDIKQLIGGDFETVKSDEFTIIHRKNSESMLANVCVDFKGKGIGTSIKGRLFAVKENEKGEFCSFPSVEEAAKVAKFLDRQGLDYSKFDEHGRCLTRAERKAKAYEERRKKKLEEINKQKKDELGVSNAYFENNFRLVPVVNEECKNNPLNSNENEVEEKKETKSTNNKTNDNNKGNPVLERTFDSSTSASADTNNMETPKIVLGDESVLKMLLRVQLIILDFLRKLTDDLDEE